MLLLLAAVVAGAVVVVLIEAAIRNSYVGFVVLLVPFVVKVVLRTTPGVALGPINVFPADLAIVIVGAALTARMMRAERMTPAQVAFLALVGLGLISLGRGVLDNGLQTAVNDFRGFAELVVAIGYASTFEVTPERLERFGRLWVRLALLLTVIATIRWVANAAGFQGGVLGPGVSLRVLIASESLVVVQGFFILLLVRGRLAAEPAMRYLAAWLLFAALLLQHRTAWIVAIACGLIVFARRRDLTRRIMAVAIGGGVVLSVLLLTVLAGSFSVQEDLSESATDSDTLQWRMEGWNALVRDTGPETALEVMYGRPFGSGWDREVGPIVVDVTPHNYYIESTFRVGVLGSALFLWMFTVVLSRLRRAPPTEGLFHRETLFVLLAGLPVYFVTYEFPEIQGMLLGVGLSAVGYGLVPRRLPADERPLVRGAGPRSAVGR